MANSLFQKPAKLALTVPQHRFFREQIKEAESFGDCRQQGLALVFDDYEGARSTLNLFMRVRPSSTREHRTWNSVIDRLNAAIRDAVKA